MEGVKPEIEPYRHGLLATGDGNRIYWEECGDPAGTAALFVHGGPGSGCSPFFRRLFDPRAYRVVLFDQRNCGRSLPHAGDPRTDLASNTTQQLVADIERLRAALDVERWVVVGGSWGSTLSLAYAERHPDRVGAMVLFGVTTGRHAEIDWAFRGGLARFFPDQWERLTGAIPDRHRTGDAPTSYARWLGDTDAAERMKAAEEWCRWESATPRPAPPGRALERRFEDSAYAFARIVTHYMSHNLWLEDGVLLRNAGVLADTPGILVNGRLDFHAPIGNPYELKRAWPRAELVVVEGAGHGADTHIASEIARATDLFARHGR